MKIWFFNKIFYKNSSYLFQGLNLEYSKCLNVVASINKNKIDEDSAKIKNKCNDIRNQFEKCTLIHKRLDSVFENKQILYIQNLRLEIKEKEWEKLEEKDTLEKQQRLQLKVLLCQQLED